MQTTTLTGILSAQVSPGARTCIVVGDPLDSARDIFGRYEHVLWFCRDETAFAGGSGGNSGKLTRVGVEPYDADSCIRAIDRLIVKDGVRKPSIYLAHEAMGESAQSFLKVVEAILAQVQGHLRARMSLQADGVLWQKNILGNLPAYLRRRMPSTWQGAAAGLPAFICGAGPSLDASIGALAAVAPHGVVISADSALRPLALRGIAVDLALSVDARKLPENCLPPGGKLPERILVAGKAPPAWRRAVGESLLYYISGSQLTEDRLAERGVSQTATLLRDNCGSTGLEVAVYLGCSPIYFFGMDNSVDSAEPTRWHHQALDASPRRKGSEAQRKLTMVPGNFQEQIGTPIYWEWRNLDQRCAALPAGLLFNITDRGAKLRNTTVVRPEALRVDSPAEDKVVRLAKLDPAVSVSAAVAEQTLAGLRAAVQRVGPWVAKAVRAAEQGDGRQAAQHLQAASRDPDFGLLAGHYCQRIVPYLRQPDSADAALWASLAAECQDLVAYAKSVD